MISYNIAKQVDVDEIMEVIDDVSLENKENSKKKTIERISEEQLLCVLSDNKIIGFLGWEKKFRNNPEYWYLEQITIQNDYRGKGIGKDFLRHFSDICRDRNIKKVFAHVQNHNKRSLNMFLNSGWVINSEANKKAQDETTFEFDIM